MATYSAEQIIGKTLAGRTSVNITRTPYDASAVIYKSSPGQVIGVVNSFVMPTTGRKNLWWEFLSNNGDSFWSEHTEGRYDIQNLQEQGALTVKEQAQAEADKDKTFIDKIVDVIQKNLTTVMWIGGGYLALKIFMQNGNKKK